LLGEATLGNGSQEAKIQERIAIGERRILNILRKHGIATMRMLEQKISDAGPNPQRVDPHLLTKARISLTNQGLLLTLDTKTVKWHYLAETATALVEQRFNQLNPIHAQTESRAFTDRMGDTAEIAVMKAMQESRAPFFGHFTDLEKHDDSQRYTKHDPDFFCGRPIEGGKLDYILVQLDAGGMGIEIKNTREWVYPDKQIVKDLLSKCVQIDVVPVLIARRIHYSAFSILNACGGVVHQIYNQLYPAADAALADLVRNKNLLGYADVRTGNDPDARLLKFFQSSLPAVSDESREKFNENRELIEQYTKGQITYPQFVGKLRGYFPDIHQPEPGFDLDFE
jgi:hypothetical protein